MLILRVSDYRLRRDHGHERLQDLVDNGDNFAGRLVGTLELHQPDGFFIQRHSGNLLLQALGLRYQLGLRGGCVLALLAALPTAEVSELKYWVNP